jgi:hypothetical protein
MPTKNLTKAHRKTCLETLQGLQTLVEMQQMLIVEAIGQLDKPDGAGKKTKPRPTARKTNLTG